MNFKNILIKKLAKEFEFDVCRVTDPKLELSTELRLKEFLDQGFHGEMKWMEETYERRRSPINPVSYTHLTLPTILLV